MKRTEKLSNLVSLHWRAFLIRSFVALGGLWTVLELYIAVTATQTGDYGIAVLAIVVTASLAIGFFLTRRHLSGADFKLRGTNTQIVISFGDIFDSTDAILIPVNTHFDHLTKQPDELPAPPVSANSVHGQLITRIGAADFRSKVDQALSSVNSTEDPNRKIEPKREFPLGTFAKIADQNREYYLVATTETDPETFAARSKLTDMFFALTEALAQIRDIGGNRAFAMPLIGSGFGRAKIDFEHLLDVIIAAIVEVSLQDKGPVAPKIEIVLPQHLRGAIRCYNVAAEWS